MKKLLYILIFLFCFASLANAATYSYYFADGEGDAGTCLVDDPCETLAKAQALIDAASSSDTVNLYFNRGDTWTENTGQTSYHFYAPSTGPTVNIDAYGAGGDYPIFDGNITDFSTVTAHDSGDPVFKEYYRFFDIRKAGCSIKNIEIKRVYGYGIFAFPMDELTVESCYIHHIGNSAVKADGTGGIGARNSTITKNHIHDCMLLYNNDKSPWYSNAISLWNDPGTDGYYSNNTISYNVIYNIYGEGISIIETNGGETIVEKNFIGDTGSDAIDIAPAGANANGKTIVRYNLITHSSAADLKPAAIGDNGITFAEEDLTQGDNSLAEIEIYGNIIINRFWGIWINNGIGTTGNSATNTGSIKAYNNTVIDSSYKNYGIGEGDEFDAGFFYNNASILYDRTGNLHASDYDGSLATWTISHNAFWTTGGSPTVDADWQTNYVVADPHLDGEDNDSFDWDGQAAGNPQDKFEFLLITPLSNSALLNRAKSLTPWDESLLTKTSIFGSASLPDSPNFNNADNALYGTIGAASFQTMTIPIRIHFMEN